MGVMIVLVTNAQAGPSAKSAHACMALLRQFDVFNEYHGQESDAGKGVSSSQARSYTAGVKRIRQAAARGNIRAEAALGDMYLEGKCGMKKDTQKALELGARAGGYFGIARMYMSRKKPMQAYKWFTIGLLKDPWYTARDIRLTLRQAGIADPSNAQVQVYLDRVATGKRVIRKRLQLLKTMADMSDGQVAKARRQAREWLKAHP